MPGGRGKPRLEWQGKHCGHIRRDGVGIRFPSGAGDSRERMGPNSHTRLVQALGRSKRNGPRDRVWKCCRLA
jgi:hypothetical protein